MAKTKSRSKSAPAFDYAQVLAAVLGAASAKIPEDKEEQVGPVLKATDSANVLASILGNIDLNALLALLLPLFAQLFNRPKSEEPKPAPSPAPTPTPAPTPAPAPPKPEAIGAVARIDLKFFWITEDGVLMNKGDFDERISRETPLREGARVCLNATPYDAAGKELKPDRYEALAWKSDGTPRMRYYGNNRDVTSITGGSHSLGCTPVLKCDRNTLDDNQVAETGGVYAVWEGDDDEVNSNTLPSLLVRGEKNR